MAKLTKAAAVRQLSIARSTLHRDRPVWRYRGSEERSLMPASIGKVLTMCGIVVIALAITPTGSRIDPHDAWVTSQWKWIQRSLRQGQDATPVTITPILFYLGILLSVVGIALS